MSVDSAGMAARLGIKPGMVVQELGWDEDADEEVGDADAEQRLHRAAEHHLSAVQGRAVEAPRQRRAEREEDPRHGSRCYPYGP